MSAHYPIFLDLRDRPCLVVGGGPVAEGKVCGLLTAGARVTVVSPTLTPLLARLAAEGALAYHARGYEPGDLAGMALALAASGDRALSARVLAEGRARGVWVNDNTQFENKRFKAQLSYVYLRGAVEHERALSPKLKLGLRLTGQIADQPLISNEQFAAGGADSVRGYYEAQLLGDSGLQGSLQLSSRLAGSPDGTLNELVEAGLLRKMSLGNRAVYEHDYGYPQHDHLYCQMCDKLIEFSSDELQSLRDAVAREHSFRVTGHRLIITGVCSDCSRKRHRRQSPLDLI